jgi:hypothetical protein
VGSYSPNTPELLWVARYARDLAADQPPLALVAITFSAATVEAFINEAAELARRHVSEDPGEIHESAVALAELLPALDRDNAQWQLKLQVASIACTGRAFPRGQQPYQDLDLLFRLRNNIMHSRMPRLPETIDDLTTEPEQLVKRLVARGILSQAPKLKGREGTQLEDREVFAPLSHSLLEEPVAVWAVETVELAIQAFVEMIPESRLRSQIEVVVRFTFGPDNPNFS